MNWIVVFCFVLLVTTMSGSIVLLGWSCISKILERIGKAEYVVSLFFVVHLFFLVPFSYWILLWMDEKHRLYSGYFLHNSRIMTVVSYRIFTVWLIGMGVQLIRMFVGIVRQQMFYKTLFACEKTTQDVFWEVCDLLQIPRERVRLYQSYGAIVPFFCGIVRPKVVLPVQNYTRQQLKVLFLHELNHYQQKDLLVKVLQRCVRMIHFFNPCTIVMGKKIALWSEFSCDCRCVRVTGDAKHYFGTLLSAMGAANTNQMLFSGLYENENEMEWRIQQGRKYYRQKKTSNGKACLLVLAVIVAASVCVMETTVLAGQFCADVFRETLHREAVCEELNKEYSEMVCGTVNSKLEEEMTELTDFPNQDVYVASGTVGKNSCIVTGSFFLEAGDRVDGAGFGSQWVNEVRIGFVDADGNFYYLNTDKANYCMRMEVTKSGNYYFRVENYDPEEIEYAITFGIQKKGNY